MKNWIKIKSALLVGVIMFTCCCQTILGQKKDAVGHWESVVSSNECLSRHEDSFVAVGDAFYLLGGRGIKPISVYNVKTNLWSEAAAPPIEIHHFQGVSYSGKIYVIGAMTGKYPYEKPLKNILVFDPKTNKWEEGAEIPIDRRRGSSGVVVNGDSAYIVSGIVDGHNSTHVKWVDQYDFKSKTWKILADAPRARDHFHAAFKNGKIYTAGGRNSSFATNQTFDLTVPEVDVYDVKTNIWSSFLPINNIPTMRAGASVVFLGDDLILIGGESVTQNEAHNNVDAYNIKTSSWRKLAPLNTGRHGSQAVVYKNKIFIVAGSGKRGGKPELSTMEQFSF